MHPLMQNLGRATLRMAARRLPGIGPEALIDIEWTHLLPSTGRQ